VIDSLPNVIDPFNVSIVCATAIALPVKTIGGTISNVLKL